MTSDETRWVWLDLEMTGLEPDSCSILEMAIIITGSDLVPVAEFHRVIWQPEQALASMSPFVREMHTKNGLLDKVRTAQSSVQDAQQAAVELIAFHCGYRKGILAGNSIYQDRRFLNRYMPVLDQFLHYRMLDVSSLKIIAQAWYGERMKFAKKNTHTALDDIRESLAELEFYREHMLNDPLNLEGLADSYFQMAVVAVAQRVRR
jgi:oligoribonuclease